MTRYTLSLEPEAEADLLEAYGWYERQRRGLGVEFMECVEAALHLVAERPLHFAAGYRGVRQTLIKRFPYVVAFLIEQETIAVIAIFHGSRDPGAWRMRLK